MQQFFLFGFKVGEETKLFQNRGCQVLGFIDNHHHPAAGRLLGQQKTVECVGEHSFAGRVGRESQVGIDRLQKLDSGQRGIKEIGQRGGRLQFARQGAQQRGFPRPDFAGQDHHAVALMHPEQEMTQGLPMRGAQKEVTRVRGETERIFLQTVKGFIHGC